MAQYPGFLGPSYQSASYMADKEQTINWMLEKNESPSSPSGWALEPTPGFATFASVVQAPIRAGIACPIPSGERDFFVAGAALYELFANGTTTLRGTLQSDNNPATISWDGFGNHLFLTSAQVGYGYNLLTNTLTSGITSLPATMGGFLSNRFLALDATSGALQISDQLSLNFNPSQIARRSNAPDPWVSMAVSNGAIYLWGVNTGEAWTDQGLNPYPFAWQQGAIWQQGIAASFSCTRDGTSPLQWIGQNIQGHDVIFQMNGFVPQRVSTHAIEQALSTYSTIADATSFTYQDRGHQFNVFTFPTGGQTWASDVDLGQAGWAQRGFWNTATGVFEASRVTTQWFGFGQNLVGDRKIGTIYTMSPTVYADVGGAPLVRVRQPPRLSQGQKRVRYTRLQLVMDVGIGLNVGQGVNPQVMLSSSNDGGKTFGAERWRSAGPIGAYNTRVFWTQLGTARNRVDRIVVSDPVPFRIVDAELESQVAMT